MKIAENPPKQDSASGLTPMLKQYDRIKSQHKDCILLFRLGDFYEMFNEDAKVASKTLDIVLTSRGKGPINKVPMCGFPFHAADNYISRLIKAGLKVAICEQVEDPSLAKGIVKRDVIRVITSGTYLDEQSSDARYLLSLSPNSKNIGIAFIDPSTGIIQSNEYEIDKKNIVDLISNLPIYECIYPEILDEKIKIIFKHPLLKQKNIALNPYSDWCFNPDIAKKALCEHFAVHNLSGFGIEDKKSAISSTGAILEYLKQMNKQPLRHIDKISLYSDTDYTFISSAAHKGLEIDQLINTIDHTLTPLGKRRLQFWVLHPLKNINDIKTRQDAVKILKDNKNIQKDLLIHLDKIPDIEKNISRLSCGYTHAKDLLAIRNTLTLIPEITKTLSSLKDKNYFFELKDLPELREYLAKTINEDIPLSNPEGKIIQKGVNAELDSLRDIQENGRKWLSNLQQQEIKRTGINSLKIGFNKVFGYYIEVTRSYFSKVPDDFIRKQTLTNAERFITPELKEFEEKILTANDKILKLESEIIKDVRSKILDNSGPLHELCQNIANLDVIYSLNIVAQLPNYVCPDVTNDTVLDIKDGRHPVVESNADLDFVPNDTCLDCEDNHLIILTGPNMAGKSTYIRQIAQLVILAQIGSFIPAQKANIGIADKIFTRIGAHDDIIKGQSTFMVEMNETADILNNLTDRSLVVLDEIGRGTSTYDGLSLAWALAEHIQKTRARTLFATHFHELTVLADKYPGIKNYNVAVKEWKDEIVFLHKIIPGGTDDSYGIYVAKLAGIPNKVINRAKQILTQLELKSDVKKSLKGKEASQEQINFFTNYTDPELEEIKEIIKALDINSLTPIDALNKMQELKEKVETDE